MPNHFCDLGNILKCDSYIKENWKLKNNDWYLIITIGGMIHKYWNRDHFNSDMGLFKSRNTYREICAAK